MKAIPLLAFTFWVMSSCNSPVDSNSADVPVDTAKRNMLVRKYDLMNFYEQGQPVFLTVDEFFDGNTDVSSIAPNLIYKPENKVYYNVLMNLAANPKVTEVLVKLNEVKIYEDGKLNDNEWFYSDLVYVIGDLTKEEVKAATKNLLPDAVEYDAENSIDANNAKYKGKKVVFLWWD